MHWFRLMMPAALVLVVVPWAAFAGPVTIGKGHLDIEVLFESGQLRLGIHDEDQDLEFAADEVRLQVGLLARTTQPANPAFAFLGAGAGNPVWILPQQENPELLFLGFDTEELDAGNFVGDLVTVALRVVRGPGQFSVWQTDAFGNPSVFYATADGIGAGDVINRPVGTHDDFNFGFTAAGIYEIDLQALAELPGGGTILGEVTTFTFEVLGDPQVVPEPSAWALLGIGGSLYFVGRRRWTKSKV